jgi:hypothetical protein
MEHRSLTTCAGLVRFRTPSSEMSDIAMQGPIRAKQLEQYAPYVQPFCAGQFLDRASIATPTPRAKADTHVNPRGRVGTREQIAS